MTDEVQPVTRVYPPGMIVYPRGDLVRYAVGEKCRLWLHKPSRIAVYPAEGTSVARTKNEVIAMALANGTFGEWMWQMGDDHMFAPEILTRLLDRMLDHDLDCVAPLCLKRKPPFLPVIYKGPGPKPGHFRRYMPWELPTSGLFGLNGEIYNCSTAGMLVHRRVIEKLESLWFANGQTTPDAQAEDLYFVGRVREAGFRVVIDLDLAGVDTLGQRHANRRGIGHTSPVTFWPCVLDDGTWGIEIDVDHGQSLKLPYPKFEVKEGP